MPQTTEIITMRFILSFCPFHQFALAPRQNLSIITMGIDLGTLVHRMDTAVLKLMFQNWETFFSHSRKACWFTEIKLINLLVVMSYA